MANYLDQANELRAKAARLYAKFDREADLGHNVAATRALHAARDADAKAAVYERLAQSACAAPTTGCTITP